MAKLCLGTVQFGIEYGIQRAGKPDKTQSLEILDLAYKSGITFFDCATAYGEAEDVVGEFLNGISDKSSIYVVSKLSPEDISKATKSNLKDYIKRSLENSMHRMQVDHIHCFLLHDPIMMNELTIRAFIDVSREYDIDNIGVSVDTPEEAMNALDFFEFNAIHIPYNVLDHRLDEVNYLKIAKERKVTIYARSPLLQGLLMLPYQVAEQRVTGAGKYVRKFEEICKSYNMERFDVAVSYVLEKPEIDYLVFGVDNMDQLKQYVTLLEMKLPSDLIEVLDEEFNSVERNIINPNLW